MVVGEDAPQEKLGAQEFALSQLAVRQFQSHLVRHRLVAHRLQELPHFARVVAGQHLLLLLLHQGDHLRALAVAGQLQRLLDAAADKPIAPHEAVVVADIQQRQRRGLAGQAVACGQAELRQLEEGLKRLAPDPP